MESNVKYDTNDQPVQMAEIMQASAIKYLIDGREWEAAHSLALCEVEMVEYDQYFEYYKVDFILKSERTVYEILHSEHSEERRQIKEAFTAILEPHQGMGDIKVFVTKMTVTDKNWREDVIEIIRGQEIHNQGLPFPNMKSKVRTFKGLNFRSMSEIKIADELDKRNILFWPNCRARLGLEAVKRKNIEADFLIMHKGKVGMIEVDGGPFHLSTRTVHDHDRDRLFKLHGMQLIEHYDSDHCYKDPSGVVSTFLSLLEH